MWYPWGLCDGCPETQWRWSFDVFAVDRGIYIYNIQYILYGVYTHIISSSIYSASTYVFFTQYIYIYTYIHIYIYIYIHSVWHDMFNCFTWGLTNPGSVASVPGFSGVSQALLFLVLEELLLEALFRGPGRSVGSGISPPNMLGRGF